MAGLSEQKKNKRFKGLLMSGCDCEFEARDTSQKKTLYVLLAINAFMFFFELVLGLIAESTGLIADSIDMFADAAVYAVALYAVSRSHLVKANAAFLSGIMLILLGGGIFVDIIRRFIFGSDPASFLIMGVGFVALIANVICLFLIYKHRKGEVHMRASWIFSKNDVIANLGVIVSGLLVYLLGSRYPDLIIGSIITFVILHSGIQVIKEALKERAECIKEVKG